MPDGLEKTELEKKWEAEAAAEETAETEIPVETDAAEAVEEPPPTESDPLDEMTKERDELKDQLLRARAEFDRPFGVGEGRLVVAGALGVGV